MKVYVVCVTYNPDLEILKQTIRSLYYQVTKFVIVDNTPHHDETFLKSFIDKYEWTSKVHLITLGDNYGIAYAQNVGLRYALKNKADFILTTDHDTIYPNKYVESLLNIFNKYENTYKIAAVVPFFRNINIDKEYYKIVIRKNDGGISFKKFTSRNNLNDFYTVYYTISSGMLINSKILEEIGFMKEEFFIDWVDTEWCLRANFKGFRILQVPTVCIQHKLGNSSVKFFNWNILRHNYIRRYYIFRNGLYMLFYYKDMNIKVRIFLAKIMLNILIKNLIVSKNKFAEIYNKYCAFVDAAKKQLGPLKRKLIES